MKKLPYAFTALIFAAAMTAGPVLAQAAPQTITITASSSDLFSPGQITVHAGALVVLKFDGKSGVHGVRSDELGIPNTLITPGATKTVTFTPKKAGTYTLYCSVPCGPDHGAMKIVVKVV